MLFVCVFSPFFRITVQTLSQNFSRKRQLLSLFKIDNFQSHRQWQVWLWCVPYCISHVQVINLTLYEYTERRQPQSSSDSSSSTRHSGVVARRPVSSSVSSCSGPSRHYAVVKERSNPVDASICASESLSDHVTTRHVFTSVSYVIELRVVARKTRDVHTAFLIHYQGTAIK